MRVLPGSGSRAECFPVDYLADFLSHMGELSIWKHSDLNFFQVVDVNLSPCSAPHWLGDLDPVPLTAQSLRFLFHERGQRHPPHPIVVGIR